MLKGLAFLEVLEDRDVEWMVANSRRREIPSGSVLIRQGEPVESLFLILDGAFNITVSVPRQHQVARLCAGELVGEMSFVDSYPASATVTAGINSSVLSIDRADLTGKMEADIGFAARFYKGISVLLSDRLRAADNGAYTSDGSVGQDGNKEELVSYQMELLARRFEEIQSRLELQKRAQGA
jgi:CRP-like cAMP-binding protein